MLAPPCENNDQDQDQGIQPHRDPTLLRSGIGIAHRQRPFIFEGRHSINEGNAALPGVQPRFARVPSASMSVQLYA